MISDVLHYSFAVSDIDRSVDWYTSALGHKPVHRLEQDNDYTRQLAAVGGAVLRVAQLKVPGVNSRYSAHVLELVGYSHGADRSDVGFPTNRTGVAHLAFIVNFLRERYVRMVGRGAQFKNPPVRVTKGANKGALACYLLDLDGVTLEFMKLSDEWADGLGISRQED